MVGPFSFFPFLTKTPLEFLCLDLYRSSPSEFRLQKFIFLTGKFGASMASRTFLRHVSRRFSSSGKVLSEEEKAAENVYIKKKEQEKLEKLARKGPKPEETTTTSTGGAGSISDAKPSAQTSSTPNVSTDKYRNYAVVAGLATAFAAFGWYYGSKKNKTVEVHD